MGPSARRVGLPAGGPEPGAPSKRGTTMSRSSRPSVDLVKTPVPRSLRSSQTTERASRTMGSKVDRRTSTISFPSFSSSSISLPPSSLPPPPSPLPPPPSLEGLRNTPVPAIIIRRTEVAFLRRKLARFASKGSSYLVEVSAAPCTKTIRFPDPSKLICLDPGHNCAQFSSEERSGPGMTP